MALRRRSEIIARSKAFVAEGIASLTAFCDAHADKFDFFPPGAGPVAFLAIRGDGLTAADAQAYSERLVEQTGVMVVAGAMFEAEGPFLRLGFAKANFADHLAAWADTFEIVRLPGH
jgi:aspartate/methionine/tyrosine aminotransferase